MKNNKWNTYLYERDLLLAEHSDNGYLPTEDSIVRTKSALKCFVVFPFLCSISTLSGGTCL